MLASGAPAVATLLAGAFFFAAPSLVAHAQAAPRVQSPVTIVLPPKLVAGQPATLAVLGADGRVAPDVTVELGQDQLKDQGKVQRVTTDVTGRAFFTAPSSGSVMFAKVQGVASVALVEPAPSGARQGIAVRLFISQRDRFSICGAAFRGDADANSVHLNAEPALILASSPECLIVLAGPKAKPGAAQIVIDTGAAHAAVSTTLVSLESEPANPPLAPGKKSSLAIRVEGSEKPLAIIVENKSPGVLRFLRGDAQQLRSSGGPVNRAQFEVETLRSGDFSFHARLAPVPDPDAARRYLEAALPLAPKDLQRTVKKLADRLAHHPGDVERVRGELDKILSSAIAGDSRTLLEASRAAL
jgi:hypothetical protein